MGFFDKFKKANKLADKAKSTVNKVQSGVDNPEGYAEGKAQAKVDDAQTRAEGKAKSELRDQVTNK